MAYIPTSVLPAQFGECFRKERKALALTQEQLAQKVGLARQTISQIEKGENVGLHTILAALSGLRKGLRIDTARINYDEIGQLDDA
ncbi:hypothetical protein WM40_11620 [Robbsia andropogonis]|uniref:HTH cro/C1-type domain-containing protein n=1 Tax=Robbsia andropogonis TaxID=28092 RepID=A0A0F5K1G4_9BURK|nr:helix-turn-helix transcriptional regulator [Robbsia andropogonis]KKB63392.1 hypothetical protein WM40_11620 [Robbsia andropogonis]MCP1120707.1 helix-turn-helix domain-containing protein [Robbsia andropogonis]MCP1130441.1 helix-turn-helix domain-containing protein [Robbsia andropogonis]